MSSIKIAVLVSVFPVQASSSRLGIKYRIENLFYKPTFRHYRGGVKSKNVSKESRAVLGLCPRKGLAQAALSQ